MWRVAKKGWRDLRSFLWTWPIHVSVTQYALNQCTIGGRNLPVVAKRPVPKMVRPTPRNALMVQGWVIMV